MITNAQFARHLARINRLTAIALAGMADGMWNPEFCEADANLLAMSVLEDLQRLVKEIDTK